MPAPDTPPVDVDRLRTSLIDDAFEWMVAFDTEGTVVYANDAGLAIAGWAPDALVGRSILDLVHPQDLERAARTIAIGNEFGPPKGTTSFRVHHADGSWVDLDVTSARVTDGTATFFAAYGRPTDYQHAVDEILLGLLEGSTVAHALRPVCDVFSWQFTGTRVAISWTEAGGGHGHVATELPVELTGADAPADSPWGQSRAQVARVEHRGLDHLDPDRRRLAEELGLWAYWIEPVTDPAGGEPALVTVWAGAGGPPPENHELGVELAANFVELVLRWTYQLRRLEQAARFDDLTGLANRTQFFEHLESETGGGALLYCDLDQFKPVNDAFGHAAGDELLRAVADRLRACVRAGDVVARLGGDEFAVLCRGASRAQADDLAARIRSSLEAPFSVAGTTVTIGISIGVAQADGRLGLEVLEAADRALYRAKAGTSTGAGATEGPRGSEGGTGPS